MIPFFYIKPPTPQNTCYTTHTFCTLLEKGFLNGSSAVPIGEAFLVPGRTLFGFSVERFVHGTQKGFLPGTKRVLPGTNKGSSNGSPIGAVEEPS